METETKTETKAKGQTEQEIIDDFFVLVDDEGGDRYAAAAPVWFRMARNTINVDQDGISEAEHYDDFDASEILRRMVFLQQEHSRARAIDAAAEAEPPKDWRVVLAESVPWVAAMALAAWQAPFIFK